MAALKPMLDTLARSYGMDPAKLDYAALSKAVEDDGRYYEDIALERGVDIQTAKQMAKEDRAAKSEQAQLQQAQAQQRVQAWRQEEAQLKEQGIAIDLNKEAENPTFMNLLQAGFGVRGAYEAVHHAEILEAAKKAAYQQAQTQTVASIRAGNLRPTELGSSQTPAAAPGPKLTPQTRAQIRAELDRGRRVDPGKFGII